QKAKYTLVQTESLTHYSPEEGTNYDTLVQAGLEENMKRFAENHQIENHTAYFDKLKNEMIHHAFHDIYSAWSELRWEDVRHLLTDRMWESNNFWINQYKENNFINVLDKITIQFIDIARIELDEYFESLTARIFATCHDYVIDTKSGAVVGGKKYDRRSYSEYWTFIRRKGVEKGLDIFDKTKCPNCGAPADKMGQNAVCGYCKTKVSTGEFGWVLSAIVQDEVYKG
ncbi:MAG: zinc-ribbon domain-containing transport protein, partial [Bacteroidota bacterium]